MANTFKVVTFAAEPASAGTAYVMYRNGANNVANGTSFLIKDAPIPAGGALDVLGTSKVILETTDVIKVDCSVADKLSGTLSIMEIT